MSFKLPYLTDQDILERRKGRQFYNLIILNKLEKNIEGHTYDSIIELSKTYSRQNELSEEAFSEFKMLVKKTFLRKVDERKIKDDPLDITIDSLIKARKQIDELNKFREYTQSCLISTHTLHIDSRKEITELKSEIFSLKQTNQDILKKLEEQIQLNSKLCERIFEMKEQQFKENN